MMFGYPEQVAIANVMAESDVLAAVLDRLDEFGLRAEPDEHPIGLDRGFDVKLVLSRGESNQTYAMVLKRNATLSTLGPERRTIPEDLPQLIGTAFVSPRSAEAFRRARIQFVDAVGNAWIEFGDVLIDVRRRRPPSDLATGPRTTGGNLFSAARAQVTFALLQWPRLWKRPQREVAEAAGVSLGQANNALAMLGEVGFGPGGHRSNAELLDLWAAAFPSGLGPKLVLAMYRGSIDGLEKVNVEDPVFVAGAVVSGEVAASDLLRPAALMIYVDQLDPLMPIRNKWRSDGTPNITVRRKFWRTPPDETHDYDGPLVGLRIAPAVLVYADLLASDDPRVRSIAPEWRHRVARLEQSF
jgi:hypothetical protein